MSKFECEKALVIYLLNRLGIIWAEISDPNDRGPETGMDVLVELADNRAIGIQVTEVDPYAARGATRAKEKTLARVAPNKPYFMWGQNDRSVILSAIVCGIERKVQIADRHQFNSVNEVWLLFCAGVPEHGAIASTFIMTPWLSADDMNSSTDHLLKRSRYSRCFFLPILGVERSFYYWDKASRWKKSVQLEATRSTPREAYVESLLNASTQQEFDQLVAKECQLILQEMRQS
jgi:hypothetical protein